jgi:hypothetical protein
MDKFASHGNGPLDGKIRITADTARHDPQFRSRKDS